MTRYARQRRIWDCGPVAFLNVLKWAGHKRYRGVPATLDYIKSVYIPLTRCKPFLGTTSGPLVRALRNIGGMKVFSIKFPTWAGVKEHVDNGGVVIISSMCDQKELKKHPKAMFGSHVSLITRNKKNKRYYSYINYMRHKSVRDITCKTARKHWYKIHEVIHAIYIRKAK